MERTHGRNSYHNSAWKQFKLKSIGIYAVPAVATKFSVLAPNFYIGWVARTVSLGACLRRYVTLQDL